MRKRYAASKQLSSSAKILADLGRSFPVAAATFDKCYGAKVHKPPFSPLSPPFFLSLFSLFVFCFSHSLSLLSLPLSSLTSPLFFLPLSSLSLSSLSLFLSLTSCLFSLPFSLVLSPSQVIIICSKFRPKTLCNVCVHTFWKSPFQPLLCSDAGPTHSCVECCCIPIQSE